MQDYRFYFLRTNQRTVEEIVLRIHVENEDAHPFDGGYSQEVYMNWRVLWHELASLPDIGLLTRNTGSLRNECPG